MGRPMARRMSEIFLSPIKAVHERMEAVGARVADYFVPSAGDQWLEDYLSSSAEPAALAAPVAIVPVPAPDPAPVAVAPTAGKKRAKSPVAAASNKKPKSKTKATASTKRSKSPTIKQVSAHHSHRAEAALPAAASRSLYLRRMNTACSRRRRSVSCPSGRADGGTKQAFTARRTLRRLCGKASVHPSIQSRCKQINAPPLCTPSRAGSHRVPLVAAYQLDSK